MIIKPLQSCSSPWLIYVVSVQKCIHNLFRVLMAWKRDSNMVGCRWCSERLREKEVTRTEGESGRGQIPGAVFLCSVSLWWEQRCVSQIPFWLFTFTRIIWTIRNQKNEPCAQPGCSQKRHKCAKRILHPVISCTFVLTFGLGGGKLNMHKVYTCLMDRLWGQEFSINTQTSIQHFPSSTENASVPMRNTDSQWARVNVGMWECAILPPGTCGGR